MDEAIRISQPDCYWIKSNNDVIGYFILNQETGLIYQLEAVQNQYDNVFSAMAVLKDNFKIINVDSDRTELITYLEYHGINNTLNQWEMSMML